MAVRKPPQQLEKEKLQGIDRAVEWNLSSKTTLDYFGMVRKKGKSYLNIIDTQDPAAAIHVLLKIPVQILKHERQRFLRVYNIM